MISGGIVVVYELSHLLLGFVDGCEEVLPQKFCFHGLEEGLDVAVLPGGFLCDVSVADVVLVKPAVKPAASEAAVVVRSYGGGFPVGVDELLADVDDAVRLK